MIYLSRWRNLRLTQTLLRKCGCWGLLTQCFSHWSKERDNWSEVMSTALFRTGRTVASHRRLPPCFHHVTRWLCRKMALPSYVPPSMLNVPQSGRYQNNWIKPTGHVGSDSQSETRLGKGIMRKDIGRTLYTAWRIDDTSDMGHTSRHSANYKTRLLFPLLSVAYGKIRILESCMEYSLSFCSWALASSL